MADPHRRPGISLDDGPGLFASAANDMAQQVARGDFEEAVAVFQRLVVLVVAPRHRIVAISAAVRLPFVSLVVMLPS